jgi:hypothetical protein
MSLKASESYKDESQPAPYLQKTKTKRVKVTFLVRTGGKVRLREGAVVTQPVKVSFLPKCPPPLRDSLEIAS